MERRLAGNEGDSFEGLPSGAGSLAGRPFGDDSLEGRPSGDDSLEGRLFGANNLESHPSEAGSRGDGHRGGENKFAVGNRAVEGSRVDAGNMVAAGSRAAGSRTVVGGSKSALGNRCAGGNTGDYNWRKERRLGCSSAGRWGNREPPWGGNLLVCRLQLHPNHRSSRSFLGDPILAV